MGVKVNTERQGVEIKWDATGDEKVTVYAEGAEGDIHNTAEMPNDGTALLSYPADFSGRSKVEVRAADGTVIDSGEISVG